MTSVNILTHSIFSNASQFKRNIHFRFVSTLIIKYVTFADAGKYDCVATQGKVFAKGSVFLTVLKREYCKQCCQQLNFFGVEV